jgi:hypothetical protein
LLSQRDGLSLSPTHGEELPMSREFFLFPKPLSASEITSTLGVKIAILVSPKKSEEYISGQKTEI